jgi:phosphoribosylamine--glycine ligase
MNALVIGQGGREHALLKKFKESPFISKLFCITGNPGTAEIAENLDIDWRDFKAVTDICIEKKIDFVFVGPDDVVVAGLADHLRANNVHVVAPSKAAAQLEGSKIFCKEFLNRANIPTAKFRIVTTVQEVLNAASEFKPPYVFKVDGLAAGKGVTLAKNLTELQAAAEDAFTKNIFGKSGERALLEEFIPGWELSFIFFTDGKNYQALPIAQDHKRLLENEEGPNTGGMGTIAPLNISVQLKQKIIQHVVQPTLEQLQKEELAYLGVIFVGLMMDAEHNPWVLEYNCRMGDPETQVLLPLIESDFAKFCFQLSQGKLETLSFNQKSACCVVLTAPGYPSNPEKGLPIEGDCFLQTENSYFIHAGTNKKEDRFFTAGGRVLGAVGVSNSLQKAIQFAYDQAKAAQWKGQYYRKDIGQKA